MHGRPPPPPAWFRAPQLPGLPPRGIHFGPPPPRPHAPPRFVDPDSVWLRQFTDRHIHPTNPEPPAEITMQKLRQNIAWGLKTVKECKLLQRDMAHLEAALASQKDDHGHARAKLQLDRRAAALHNGMEQLRAFDATFFKDTETYTKALRLAKRVAKKKKYRQVLRQRTKAQTVILKGLDSPPDAPVAASVPPTEVAESTLPNLHRRIPFKVPASPSAKSPLTAKQRMRNEALSTRVRLLLELKQKRCLQAWTAADEAAQTAVADVQAARTQAMRPPSPPPAQAIAPEPTTPQPVFPLHEAQMTMDSLVAVRFAWDSHLVFDGKGSRIPPHMVDPPTAPSQAWQPFMESSGTVL
ncbi:hypothetical protein ACHHYP_13068 [Achlya hypogyna]|uniref:Uncharacterized protein n=1 Tax=Achlya hypogyna TaxID=1202772 RepID=A0A1V9YFZ6_ACHHY|nr:hypothetical protein ACHHYP_13068 [Achlya hypogyna]